MSSRPLLITKRQARVLYDVAEEKRGIAEVNPKTGVIRLIPAVLADVPKEPQERVDHEPEGTM